MSLISDFSASVTVPASRSDILDTLLDATHLPDWNPAFTSVTPSSDGAWHVQALGVLGGTLNYVTDAGSDLAMNITIPGLYEHSTWQLEELGNGTRVTHRVTQKGPLTRIIGHSEASLVPGKRLSRLAEYVTQKLSDGDYE